MSATARQSIPYSSRVVCYMPASSRLEDVLLFLIAQQIGLDAVEQEREDPHHVREPSPQRERTSSENDPAPPLPRAMNPRGNSSSPLPPSHHHSRFDTSPSAFVIDVDDLWRVHALSSTRLLNEEGNSSVLAVGGGGGVGPMMTNRRQRRPFLIPPPGQSHTASPPPLPSFPRRGNWRPEDSRREPSGWHSESERCVENHHHPHRHLHNEENNNNDDDEEYNNNSDSCRVDQHPLRYNNNNLVLPRRRRIENQRWNRNPAEEHGMEEDKDGTKEVNDEVMNEAEDAETHASGVNNDERRWGGAGERNGSYFSRRRGEQELQEPQGRRRQRPPPYYDYSHQHQRRPQPQQQQRDGPPHVLLSTSSSSSSSSSSPATPTAHPPPRERQQQQCHRRRRPPPQELRSFAALSVPSMENSLVEEREEDTYRGGGDTRRRSFPMVMMMLPPDEAQEEEEELVLQREGAETEGVGRRGRRLFQREGLVRRQLLRGSPTSLFSPFDNEEEEEERGYQQQPPPPLRHRRRKRRLPPPHCQNSGDDNSNDSRNGVHDDDDDGNDQITNRKSSGNNRHHTRHQRLRRRPYNDDANEEGGDGVRGNAPRFHTSRTWQRGRPNVVLPPPSFSSPFSAPPNGGEGLGSRSRWSFTIGADIHDFPSASRHHPDRRRRRRTSQNGDGGDEDEEEQQMEEEEEEMASRGVVGSGSGLPFRIPVPFSFLFPGLMGLTLAHPMDSRGGGGGEGLRDFQEEIEQLLFPSFIAALIQRSMAVQPAFPPLTVVERKELEFEPLSAALVQHLQETGIEECTVCQERFEEIWKECEDCAACPSLSSSTASSISSISSVNEGGAEGRRQKRRKETAVSTTVADGEGQGNDSNEGMAGDGRVHQERAGEDLHHAEAQTSQEEGESGRREETTATTTEEEGNRERGRLPPPLPSSQEATSSGPAPRPTSTSAAAAETKYHRRHDVLICRLPCNHFFCKECLLKWMLYTSTCPNCRLLLKDVAMKYEEDASSRPSWWDGKKDVVEVVGQTEEGEEGKEKKQKRRREDAGDEEEVEQVEDEVGEVFPPLPHEEDEEAAPPSHELAREEEVERRRRWRRRRGRRENSLENTSLPSGPPPNVVPLRLAGSEVPHSINHHHHHEDSSSSGRKGGEERNATEFALFELEEVQEMEVVKNVRRGEKESEGEVRGGGRRRRLEERQQRQGEEGKGHVEEEEEEQEEEEKRKKRRRKRKKAEEEEEEEGEKEEKGEKEEEGGEIRNTTSLPLLPPSFLPLSSPSEGNKRKESVRIPSSSSPCTTPAAAVIAGRLSAPQFPTTITATTFNSSSTSRPPTIIPMPSSVASLSFTSFVPASPNTSIPRTAGIGVQHNSHNNSNNTNTSSHNSSTSYYGRSTSGNGRVVLSPIEPSNVSPFPLQVPPSSSFTIPTGSIISPAVPFSHFSGENIAAAGESGNASGKGHIDSVGSAEQRRRDDPNVSHCQMSEPSSSTTATTPKRRRNPSTSSSSVTQKGSEIMRKEEGEEGINQKLVSHKPSLLSPMRSPSSFSQEVLQKPQPPPPAFPSPSSLLMLASPASPPPLLFGQPNHSFHGGWYPSQNTPPTLTSTPSLAFSSCTGAGAAVALPLRSAMREANSNSISAPAGLSSVPPLQVPNSTPPPFPAITTTTSAPTSSLLSLSLSNPHPFPTETTMPSPPPLFSFRKNPTQIPIMVRNDLLPSTIHNGTTFTEEAEKAQNNISNNMNDINKNKRRSDRFGAPYEDEKPHPNRDDEKEMEQQGKKDFVDGPPSSSNRNGGGEEDGVGNKKKKKEEKSVEVSPLASSYKHVTASGEERSPSFPIQKIQPRQRFSCTTRERRECVRKEAQSDEEGDMSIIQTQKNKKEAKEKEEQEKEQIHISGDIHTITANGIPTSTPSPPSHETCAPSNARGVVGEAFPPFSSSSSSPLLSPPPALPPSSSSSPIHGGSSGGGGGTQRLRCSRRDYPLGSAARSSLDLLYSHTQMTSCWAVSPLSASASAGARRHSKNRHPSSTHHPIPPNVNCTVSSQGFPLSKVLGIGGGGSEGGRGASAADRGVGGRRRSKVPAEDTTGESEKGSELSPRDSSTPTSFTEERGNVQRGSGGGGRGGSGTVERPSKRQNTPGEVIKSGDRRWPRNTTVETPPSCSDASIMSIPGNSISKPPPLPQHPNPNPTTNGPMPSRTSRNSNLIHHHRHSTTETTAEAPTATAMIMAPSSSAVRRRPVISSSLVLSNLEKSRRTKEDEDLREVDDGEDDDRNKEETPRRIELYKEKEEGKRRKEKEEGRDGKERHLQQADDADRGRGQMESSSKYAKMFRETVKETAECQQRTTSFSSTSIAVPPPPPPVISTASVSSSNQPHHHHHFHHSHHHHSRTSSISKRKDNYTPMLEMEIHKSADPREKEEKGGYRKGRRNRRKWDETGESEDESDERWRKDCESYSHRRGGEKVADEGMLMMRRMKLRNKQSMEKGKKKEKENRRIMRGREGMWDENDEDEETAREEEQKSALRHLGRARNERRDGAQEENHDEKDNHDSHPHPHHHHHRRRHSGQADQTTTRGGVKDSTSHRSGPPPLTPPSPLSFSDSSSFSLGCAPTRVQPPRPPRTTSHPYGHPSLEGKEHYSSSSSFPANLPLSNESEYPSRSENIDIRNKGFFSPSSFPTGFSPPPPPSSSSLPRNSSSPLSSIPYRLRVFPLPPTSPGGGGAPHPHSTPSDTRASEYHDRRPPHGKV